MASLSLPRVLQLKKNSLDAEREHFEKFQTLAIQKAINTIETPVKEKHVRSTIIGTFQEQSAVTYWMVAIRLPLQENRIVAWKFCHVTHKLLREGHPACLDDSQRHINMIENLGKLWVHLREGYGRLVHLYCRLLVCKLKFHARNPRFPPNMQLTAEELDAIAENDVNNYFQLCVELFDYMDDILNLQAAVFESLGNARANSMTASGQCRLAALIPCAQDASHIYDCNVRLLFRLHATLPPDTLAGHRERFRQQFKKLSSFYKHASSLQYYRNLLTLPLLPTNPPNFLSQSDFGTYVTPVVSIPEPPADELDAVGSLIDTSDTMSQATSPEHLEAFEPRGTPSPQPDPVVERDRLIDHLQNELKRMRSEVSQMIKERNTMLGSMRDHCTRLETQLQTTKAELEEEKQRVEILAVQTPEIKQKLSETEEKAKVTDEKFQKLKVAYTQLREEHITLIRQKAEVDKLSANLRAAAAQHESAKMALQQQLNDRIKDVELLQQSASSSEEIEAYKNEIANLRTDLEQSRLKEVELQTLRASMEALQIEHETATTEQQEKLTTITNELKEVTENLEKIRQEKEERESELNKVKEELILFKEKSGEEYKKVVEEKETALKDISELSQQYQQEKEDQANIITGLEIKLENLQQKLEDAEIDFANQFENLQEELNNKNIEFEDNIYNKDEEIKDALGKLSTFQIELDTIKIKYEQKVNEQNSEINSLQENLNELVQYKEANIILIEQLEAEKNTIQLKLDETINERDKFQEILIEKEKHISDFEDRIKELLERDNSQKAALVQLETIKNQQILQLKDNLEKVTTDKDSEIAVLKGNLQEKTNLNDEQKCENEVLLKTVSELETNLNDKNSEISKLQTKINEALSSIEYKKIEFEGKQQEYDLEITSLKSELNSAIKSKDETIQTLNSTIAEKDEQLTSFNNEVKNLSEDVVRLEDDLKETQAELEIGKNELLNLTEEHEVILEQNEKNLVLKNQELRNVSDEVTRLSREKTELENEKERLTNEFSIEKQGLENNIIDLEEAHEKLNIDHELLKSEKEEAVEKLTKDLDELKSEYEQLKADKDNEIQTLNYKIQEQESNFNLMITEKESIITESNRNVEELNVQLEESQRVRETERADMEQQISERDKEKQMLNGRLEHIEREKLNVECELQDLLQHNTVLEADLAAAKIQLDETKKELEKQRIRLVSCAGEAALQVTEKALTALERGSPRDSNQAAAELAVKALDELTKHTEIQGNEESLARCAIFAAHNTAQLSAYVTDVSNVSTDMQLADKLNSECRNMLTKMKDCLESLKNCSIEGASSRESRLLVRSVAAAAAAADRNMSGTRSVDDELADMDQAIEDAALQIEEMLAASRAGDSGVKLEVNGKILDACTTLMGAVKVLVQDARKLQQELGDPSTRQKVYRRNPQWSEGLISAAKAVVFAAKLLVTSADEAVGSAGRVEGVSAAAHEVAGSTAQLVAASRARAPPASPALARLGAASRAVAAATGAVVAAVRAASALVNEHEALDTSALTLTATRRLEMESKVRSLELESALDAERARLAALRKRHYQLAQMEENGNMTNGKE